MPVESTDDFEKSLVLCEYLISQSQSLKPNGCVWYRGWAVPVY